MQIAILLVALATLGASCALLWLAIPRLRIAVTNTTEDALQIMLKNVGGSGIGVMGVEITMADGSSQSQSCTPTILRHDDFKMFTWYHSGKWQTVEVRSVKAIRTDNRRVPLRWPGMNHNSPNA